MCVSAIIGGILAIAGQLVVLFNLYIFYPTPAVPMPAYPNSYVYRTGMCLLCGALAYWICRKWPPGRLSPLRLLGQTSMLVYIVHIELVYGFVSWPIRYRLSPIPGALLVAVLTAMMVGLAYWRIEIWAKRPAKSKPGGKPDSPNDSKPAAKTDAKADSQTA
jgi:peptidoglycan/LPS O-acetylase OafA/YrhL